jgi:hypothetical protein
VTSPSAGKSGGAAGSSGGGLSPSAGVSSAISSVALASSSSPASMDCSSNSLSSETRSFWAHEMKKIMKKTSTGVMNESKNSLNLIKELADWIPNASFLLTIRKNAKKK